MYVEMSLTFFLLIVVTAFAAGMFANRSARG
jgi:hypothetical protein